MQASRPRQRDESGQIWPIGRDVLESPKNTQNPRRASQSFLFSYQEHQFNRLDSHEGAVGVYIYQALCLVAVCPLRFRDQFLPVVNRTSDIKKLSTMCFISGKHSCHLYIHVFVYVYTYMCISSVLRDLDMCRRCCSLSRWAMWYRTGPPHLKLLSSTYL
jgi:hypothetical protein